MHLLGPYSCGDRGQQSRGPSTVVGTEDSRTHRLLSQQFRWGCQLLWIRCHDSLLRAELTEECPQLRAHAGEL